MPPGLQPRLTLRRDGNKKQFSQLEAELDLSLPVCDPQDVVVNWWKCTSFYRLCFSYWCKKEYCVTKYARMPHSDMCVSECWESELSGLDAIPVGVVDSHRCVGLVGYSYTYPLLCAVSVCESRLFYFVKLNMVPKDLWGREEYFSFLF